MNPDAKSVSLAERVLNLLLNRDQGSSSNRDDWNQTDWDLLYEMALKNVILVRTFDALGKKGVSFPQRFSEEVQKEKKRIQQVVALVGRISRLCRENDIRFLMPTVLKHYPDMGGDIDLLVADRSGTIDTLLKKDLNAKPLPNGLLNRISADSWFTLGPSFPSIEVHHGRIGLLGEHDVYPSLMVKNGKWVLLDGIDVPIPCPEDQILYQAIHRVYGRFYFRISDVVAAITLLLIKTLNWDYILKTASAIGVTKGLGVYLSQIDEVYHEISGVSLLPEPMGKVAGCGGKDRLSFNKSYYRYPTLPVTSRVYSSKMVQDLFSGRFESALRLCLIPCVALTYLIRNTRGRRSRYFD